MAKGPTAKRYATALFQLAQTEGREQAWQEALAHAQAFFAEPAAQLFFTTPRVAADRKLDAVRRAFPQADRTFVNFLGLLAGRQATALVPAITHEYRSLLNASLGRVQAAVTSAVAMGPEQQERLRQQMARLLEQDVALETTVDPEIIGGVVVRVGDQVLDGSVRGRLEAMRVQLARGVGR